MRRLSIGRLIAVIFAVTVVLLFSIDTALACRFLWRPRCYTPVYYCPPACEVITYSSCGSEVVHGESVGMPSEVTASPVPAEPPQVESVDEPVESPLDDTPPMPDEFDDTPVEAADSIIDDSVLPGDEPSDLDLPTDDGLPEDTTDAFSEPLPDESPAVDPEVDEFLPEDDLGLPADDFVPGDDLPGDDLPADDLPADDLPGDDLPADDLDDLFSETPAVEGDDARVANNPEEEVDDLFEDVDIDESTDLPADTDVPDDLFPADDAEMLPEDDGGAADDDLDDLFSKAPEATEAETLGFREVDQVEPASKVTKTVEQPQAAPLFRVWTDNTGSYRTVGQLVKISDNHVRLLKDNGRFSTVPMRRLSDSDLAYVQRMAKQMGTEAIEKIASR